MLNASSKFSRKSRAENPKSAASIPDNGHSPAAISNQPIVPWNTWLAVVFMIIVFYASQVFSSIALSIYASFKHLSGDAANTWLTNSVTAQFVYILIAETIGIGAIWYFLRIYKTKLSIIGLKRPRLKDIGIGLLASPVYYVLFIIVVSVASSLLSGLNIDQKQEIGFNNVHGLLPLAMTFISLVVLPPLAEEIMVRGFLYSSLKKSMPKIAAVILTSAIFAAAHLPEGGASGPLYIAAIDTFTLSLVLIYLREKTGSLWASITLHAIKNGIAFFALFVFTSH